MKPGPYKVLHPITRLIVGGAQEHTMYTAAMLDKAKYQVEVVCGPQTGSEGSMIQEVRDQGVPLEIIPELVREINPWKDLAAFWTLFRRMKSGGYTIVHTNSSKAGILARLAAKFAGVPIIVHNVHGWSFHDRMNPARRRIFIFLERFTARLSDALIVVAERDIKKGLAEKIGDPELYHLIRSAIPLEMFSPEKIDRGEVLRELGIPLDVPVLGNIGRLSPQKNPLDWVRVAKKVSDDFPRCRFLLVGDGPLRKEVESMLRDVGIANRTILTGLRRDVTRMLAAMDVFLLTSLWEGLPRVIPQAMAMKIPVVANRVDGAVEAIEHGLSGYLCEPGEIQQMAGYCVDLLKSPQLRMQIGEHGQTRVLDEFDLEVMIAQIEELYQELLSRKGL